MLATQNNTEQGKGNAENNPIGDVNTLSLSANYQSDPLAVYQKLCGNANHNVLLESAEVDKKHQLHSWLLVDAALKIVCHGNQVRFIALSDNGEAALAFAAQQLSLLNVAEQKVALNPSAKQLVATFSETPHQLDERSRLTSTNAFASLRLFERLNNRDQHPLGVFLAGVFAFDMIAVSEQLIDVPAGENTCPDFVYYLAETLVVIDHLKLTCDVIGNIFSGPKQQDSQHKIAQRLAQIEQVLKTEVNAPAINASLVSNNSQQHSAPLPVTTDIDDATFCDMVVRLKQHICKGDIFQVVPSRTFSLPCSNASLAYQALKRSNPSPYMFYLKDSEFCIFGASPESAIKYQQSNRQVEVYPIAGTRPRGFDANGKISPDLDSRIELELRQDKKELAEHTMLVDLARNDIARVSQAGTRYVADLLKVDRYSHVMHLVSRVCGTLSTDLDALHAYQACMNMGTLSGAPKLRATQLIRQFEGKRRGSYGGAVGYITGEGDMDTCIVIRSAFVRNNVAHIQAGAGVVFDSDPLSEANETRQKAQAVINAVQSAALVQQQHDQGETL
jgi:anthranilate synthase component 1